MPSVRPQYAHRILIEHQIHHAMSKGGIEPLSPPERKKNEGNKEPIRVGILGAGIAGLYAALLIDYLGSESGIVYDILEANPDRIGGRLYTHRFSDSPNDYFDAGAMRYPKIPWMKTTFELFKYLELDRPETLIPYHLNDPLGNNFQHFNNISKSSSQLQTANAQGDFDPFRTKVVGLTDSVDDLLGKKLDPFKRMLAEDFQMGWEDLMSADQLSMRDWLAIGIETKPYSEQLINYLETVAGSTGLFNCALSEAIMDAMDFDYQPAPDWFTIQGGGDVVSNSIIQRLTQPIRQDCRVIAITPVLDPKTSKPTSLKVATISKAGSTVESEYAHVISTMPFGCLSMVDTSALEFSWDLQTAIRTLHYDSAIKVAIKFKQRWWEKLTRPQIGGSSTTDRPLRTVVYPSYGIGSEDATMIVSYTWAQDARRMGSYATGHDSASEQLLIERIKFDLADMHDIDDMSILDHVDHKIVDWYKDEYASGAFALLAPGQFSSIYREVTQPVMGMFHFAGEATSVHHAWVVGSLNSAYRAVLEILIHEGNLAMIDKLTCPESPFQQPDEINSMLTIVQVALGQSHRLSKPVDPSHRHWLQQGY
ncbi:amine oxidase [Dendrothele bispora CBS 962.96]|uniref:Amine oxidase n=1 Tax=Dendrothele bispora (strain CBS 962.96) TaxID=1314807 RepID=A0A4S8L485_DENBC|nr:amine oxidase [Dendrothele bispora CBS 962.96]